MDDMATPTTSSGRTRLLDCAPSQVGPCTRCQEACHRYGAGGCPLCADCLAKVEAARAPKR